ncbi:CPBP family intramembrane glutamic endopeptidase [Staphylococcus warneri]|uniref:CPBP family intramembrane glutamic endopeptidase n=1 Tax=Staphylococcus warneri TaxID=1292 RepID=UPI001304C18E
MTILENKKTTLNDHLLISNNFHDLPLITFLLFLVTITFISPIIEELIYRGILRFQFFKADKLYLPLIISSTIFSIFHLTTDFISFIMYFLAGSLLFYNYYKSNNLTQSILLHISNNLFFSIELVQNYFN